MIANVTKMPYFERTEFMAQKKSHILCLGMASLWFASCAPNPNDPRLQKTHAEYVNPHQPGTYEHFVAEKSYPKTYDTWTDTELYQKTDPSNSWLRIELATQRGMLMNGDRVVIDYPISSGRESHPTPPGKYKVLEKVVDKSSNKYGRIYCADGKVVNSDANILTDEVPEGGKFVGAPMRYWMRLTWDGVGHHIGPVKRYPVSHACIRGPHQVMPKVYSKLVVGSKVMVD
ncbi:MAG: hypothetical protein RL346_1848 [Verrucomicrobiota bacterium]|jgi:lipoprotein-anchoring transpeptidase ErfK/SrfK